MLKRLPALICLALLSNSATPAPNADKYAITDLSAHLYHESSGAFDHANIASERSPHLWNTIIGEGDAGSPSNAMLVLVKVRGRWVSDANPPKLRLIAQDKDGTELLNKAVDLKAFFSEGSTITVPFIAYGTGCSEIRLTATLIGGRGTSLSKLSKKVPFECGE
jgi:hypothetical protein